MRSTKARTWYNPSLYFLLPLLLLPTPKAAARSLIFSERAYVNVGFGEFQCERFRETKGAYIKKDIKASHVLNLGVGYKISGHVRSNINFQYTKLTYKANNQDGRFIQNITVLSSMINLNYDLYEEASINPYITAGVGISRIRPTDLIEASMNLRLTGISRTNFAWNVGGGVLLNTMSRDYEIDLGYRYIDHGIVQVRSLDPVSVHVTQRIIGHQGIISVLFKL